MSFQPNWKHNATGWFPIPSEDRRSICLYCKEPLKKVHGLNQNRPGEPPSVMALFLFGAGPFCITHGLQAWCDTEFMSRSGSNEYHASNFDLNADFRPKNLPSIEDELKKL